MPRVSVIIPTYNRADLISDTLDSVLVQTYRDFEVIVVDDGSTDNTTEVLTSYQEHIRVIRQNNQGLSAARNAGISQAKGEFIAFLDSDDLWLPTKLERQMALLDDRPGLCWAYTDVIAFNHDTGMPLYVLSKTLSFFEGDVLEKLLLEDFIATPTPMIHRTVFDKVGFFYDNVVVAEDWDMWMRIAAHYPIGLVAMPLARYRVHANMKTRTRPWQHNYERCLNTIERAIARNPERLSPLRERAIAQVCIIVGRRLMREGNLSDARDMFAEAVRHAPHLPKIYFHWLMCFLGRPAVNTGFWLQNKLRYRQSLQVDSDG